MSPAARAPLELELLAALPLEAPERFDASGLAWQQGRLLVVSDKHDTTVYELGLEAERAVARPFAGFELPPGAPEHLDWEGVSADGARALLLVSESAYRVARIELAGSDPEVIDPAATAEGEGPASPARWITPALRTVGEAAGCFQERNAGFEGVARLDGDALLLAIERQPRGLMDVVLGADAGAAHARAMPESSFAVAPGRVPDFTDLSVDGGKLYALLRNAHVVVRLERHGGVWVEGQGVSYAATENDARYLYADANFGLGEGLALTADRIFVVLDNNGQSREGAPADVRPLLFVFRRPPGF